MEDEGSPQLQYHGMTLKSLFTPLMHKFISLILKRSDGTEIGLETYFPLVDQTLIPKGRA